MKNIGKIQEKIIIYFRSFPDGQGYLGVTTRTNKFPGLYWEDVEASINRLLKRGILIEKARDPETKAKGFYKLVKMRGDLDNEDR